MIDKKTALFMLLATMHCNTAFAHEFWLEPRVFSVETGESLNGDLKNGQFFKGSQFSYVEKNFDQFTITGPDGTQNVKGRNGDRPAFAAKPDEPGLYSVSYQGKFDRITFTDPEKLKHYVEYEGFTGVLERHEERGLPLTRFFEQYARCAKALFQVGSPDTSERQDGLTGMKFELVAEKNPYALTDGDTLPVRLYWEGEPMADVQIRMFQINSDLATKEIRTDSEGRAVFPLTGSGKFMLNAVHIFEGDDDPETQTAEWISYWASLTFGISDTDEVLEASQDTNK